MKKHIEGVRSGDVVYADRGLYRHYGVYDNGKVIDVSFDNGSKSLRNTRNARVGKKSLRDFLNGDPGYVDNSPGCHSRKQTLKRARAEIGTGKNYDLVFNNCEHKAREWQTGRKKSGQVEDVVKASGAGLGLAIGLGLLGLFG